LRKSDEKDEINGEESQQVGVDHLVDHDDEWSNDLRSSEHHNITMNSTDKTTKTLKDFTCNFYCKHIRYNRQQHIPIKINTIPHYLYPADHEQTIYGIYTGRSLGQAEGLAGCGHSKIARVRAYYLYCMWLPLLTSLQI